MKCEYLNKEFDEDRQTAATYSCELGYFEDEDYHTIIKQFCTGCEDKEMADKSEDDDDD